MKQPTDKLTTTEASKIVADYINVIELSVLDVIQYQPSGLYQSMSDIVGDATVAVLKSLRSFQRRFLSVANITAWVRKAARWTALNAVTAYVTRRNARHMVDTTAVADMTHKQEIARMEAALDVLTDESRTVLVGLVNGESAGSIAKRMKLSAPTITRRKQEAMKAIKLALAA
jgi:DNA-directed RNA polymerase specialized sigma24 family protein